MSKIDQLRRQREQQHERQERQVVGPAVRARPEIAPVPAPAPARAPARAATSLADEARGPCSVCGKVRALKNGLVSDHQKGLGKMCTGSRKEPAPA